MRFAPILGLILASAAFAQDAKQGSSSDYTMKPFRALDTRVGGSWLAHWNAATNTPDTIYGTGLVLADWRGNTIEEARRQALKALDEQADLLQLGASEFRESIGARMGRTWSFTFDQYFAGLPCIGGRADIRVNMKGVLAMLGSTAWQIPADFTTIPTVDEVEAQAKAWLALDQRQTGVAQPGKPRENRLVIWGDVFATTTAPFYLAWEIPVSNVDAQGRGTIGRYYIDASNGTVLHFATDKHECNNPACTNATHNAAPIAFGPPMPSAITPTTVTVMAWTRDGQSATAPLNNIPLVGLQVTVPGFGVQTTDANGQFTIDIAAPVTITVTNLDGRHCSPITDVTGNQPNVSITVSPGVPATLQLLSAAVTQEQATHVATFFWIDTANEWVRSIVGNVAQMNTADAVSPRVNTAGTCNAFYTGNTVNFYPNGGGCNNTGFSTVVVHEWGHGIDDRFGGISNANGDGLSEGWGDIFGMFHPLVDNPIVGINFTTAGGSIRTGLNTKLYGTQTEVHAAGEVWMGFAWRLRENLRAALGTPAAIAISNDIVIGSVVANATNQANAVIQVFLADDDDGNVSNGTPHYAQLSAAATTKGMPFPQIQPVTVQHTALTDTTQRKTPRIVNAIGVTNTGGTITQLRLVYSVAGGATQSRVMVPNGAVNGYRALLPGVSSGSIAYHIEADSTAGNGRLPTTGEFSYSTLTGPGGPFVGFYSENFEGAATGWTHTRSSGTSADDWQIGTPNGKSGTSLGQFWADPLGAGAGTRAYATDLGTGTSNGSYPTNMNYFLTSPVINCAGRTGVTLRFKRWLSVEESAFDHAQINVNGILVWENPIAGNLVDNSWQTFEYPLPMADNNPSVQVEFRLISDAGLQLGGWNIDDVELGTRTLPTLPSTLTVTPEQANFGQNCFALVTTDSPFELFAIVIGDNGSATTVSPFPTVLVGGNLSFEVGITDAAGNYGLTFPSLAGAPPGGFLVYTQVLVFEAGGGYTTSNQNLSLFLP